MVLTLRKNTKAITIGFLVIVIISILSFILIAGTIFRFYSKADEREAEALCRNSVALRAATALQVGNTEAKGAPLLCKTIDAKISGKNAEDVETQIADRMARCWNTFGEGRYDTSVFENTNIFGGQSKCFVCYTMLVEETNGFGKDEPVSADQFSSFLREKKYAVKDQTYLDYIQHGGGSGFVLQVTPTGITAGRAYAIAYKAKTTKCGWCTEFGLAGGGSALAGGASITILGVGTGGIALLVGGVVVATAVGVNAIHNFFSETYNTDGIMIVDMNHETVKEAFTQTCDLIPDIAGV